VLRLATFGQLELQRDGAPPEAVALQPKRLALLAYLALNLDGGYCRRDLLLALLWPERDQTAARHALRHALYHLRNVLGDGVLVSRGTEEIGLAQPVWSDAWAFARALDDARPGEALALYRGDFLAGVFVDGASPEWDEWVSHTRDHLRTRAAAAAWKVAELAVQSGEVARGLDAAQRAQALDPDNELGLQRLMRWLEQFGRRPAALQLFGDFARRMRGEYQAEPSADTAALAEAIRGAAGVQLPLITLIERSPSPSPAPPWPAPGVRACAGVWRLRIAARQRRPRAVGPTAGLAMRSPGSDRASDTELPR